MSTEMNRMTTENSQLTTSKTELVSSSHVQFIPKRMKKANLFAKSMVAIALIFSAIFGASAQTTYDFSTAATISNPYGGSWPWNTQAVVTIGGVQYKLTSGGNGSFTNVSTGGATNSANLLKDGSGGDQFTLERMDGQAFQFYGIWVKHQSMNSYSQFYTLPPWYTLTADNNGTTTYTYQDMTPMTAGTAWNNYTGSSTSINPGAGGVIATSVQISFQAIITFNIDNIIVGPVTSAVAASPASLSNFSTCQGTASATQTTSVSGSNLSADLVLTAPSGYEISTSAASGYSSTLTLTQSGGTINATTIYVRLAASATAGTYNGNLAMVSGSTTSNVALTGTVNASPVLTVTNPSSVCTPATVDLTAAAVTAGSTGVSTLGYFTNSGATTALGTPSAVAISGTYYIKATSASGCTDIKPVVVSVNAALTAVTLAANDLPCGSTATGSATVTLTGGAPSFTYTWTRNGSAYVATPSSAPTNLLSGTYVVSVTDGCGTTVQSNSVSLTNAIAINLQAASAGGNALCFGGNGSISGSIFGGTSQRSLVVTNTSTNQVYTQITPSGPAVSGVYPFSVNVPQGTYSVSAIDAGSTCPASTWPSNITITQPAAALAATTAKTDVCFGATNGTITVTATGGTAGYTYSKDGGTTYQASNSFTGLAAGTYSIVVKDANNCTTTPASVTIAQPASALAVVATSQTNIACNGASTGAINITASGGYSTAYTYAWTGPSSFTSTSEDLTNRAAGTYNVTVTDAGGCTATLAVTLTQPTALSASTTVTNVSCNAGTNGTVTLSVTGGTPGYTYAWTGPSSFTATTANLTGRSAGAYTVTVTDANACTTTATATITQPAVLTTTITSVSNVLCNGGSTGSVNLTVAGGTTPYSFAWTGTSFTASTEDISSLAAGTYNVTVTDSKGCTSTSTATVTQPVALSATAVVTNVACFGASTGAINVTAAGGTTPYTYSTDGTTFQSSSALTGLAAGTFTVTVKDANGCIVTLSKTITQPASFTASTTVTNLLCNGASTGAATLTVNGGTSPYTYAWTGPSSFTATTANISSRPAGTYNVTVTDQNNCTATASAVITQPTAISVTAANTNVSCNGGSNGTLTVTATGGTPGYTYSINGTTFQASNSFTGLAAGSYTITVKDANNCTSSTIKVITQPAVLAITDDGTSPASCANTTDGASFITPTGGSAPYTYAWTGPSSFTSTTQDQVYNLAPGTYSVTVTDANACSATLTNLVVTSPPAINIATVATNVLCYQGSTGAINATITGGSPAFTFQWKKNGSNFATTEDLTNLTAGTYVVTVTDGNFCQQTSASVVITEGAALAATTAATSAAICSGANAVFTITGTAGNVVTYNINGGSNTTATIGVGGTATVTVTAATANQTLNLVSVSNGSCSNAITGTASVTVNALPTANAGVDQTVCAGASVTLSGAGTGTYAWNNSVTNGVAFTAVNATALSITTTYTLTVTNANGCTNTDQVDVTVKPLPVITAISNQTVCNGSQTTAVTFANNLVGTTYAWTNNTTSIGLAASGSGNIAAFTAVNAGTAPVTATISVIGTNTGCASAPSTFTISVNPTPTVNNFTSQTVCAGSATTAVVPGGAVTGTNYNWTNSNTSIGLAASGTGTIPSFTAVNAAATAATATVTVTPVYGGNMGTTFGEAAENGSITLTAPTGTYFTGVQFASYGTPTGTLGSYTVGSCHAANSSSVVAALAVGQTTVTIPANNATFGNPCGSTPKTLAVVLTYGTFGSSCSGTAKTFTFTVNPVATIANKTATVCSGSAFTATTGGSDVVPTGTQYTWTVAPNANVTGAANQATAVNTISQTLTNTSNTVQTVVYTVTPVSGTCTGATFTVTVTVNPTPVVTAQTATACSGIAFNVTPANGSGNIVPAGTTYSWSAPGAITGISGQASGTAQSSIGGTLSNTNSTATNVTYVVTPTSGSCTGASFNVVVTVNPRPVISNMTSTVCAGSAFTVTPVNVTNGTVPPGTTYTWTVVDNTNVTGESNVSTASNNISQTLTNSTVTAQVVNYTVTPTFATCAGATFALAVTVNPIPVIANKTATICSGSAFSVAPTNGTDLVPTGTTYTWTVAANANVSGQSNQAVAQSSIAQTLTSSSNVVQTVVYTVTPTFGGCSGTPFTVTVTVNPTPSIITQVTNACSGTAFTLSPVNGSGNVVPAGTTYTWTVVDNPNVVGETNANTAQANVSQTLVNAYTTSQQVVYTVTPTAGSCVGLPFTYTVTVSTPVNVAALTGATNVCLGSTTQLASATTGGAWTSSNTAVATVSSTGVVTGLTTGSTTISYTVTNSAGCTGVVSAVVNVNALPVATITPSGATTICDGATVTLTASSGTSYLWSNGLQTQSITVSTGGNYSVQVTNAAGCSVTSSAVAVVVNALPTVTVAANGPTTFCQGGSVTLTASAGSTYAWSNGLTTQSITVTASGNYSVTVTNASGCSATSAPTTVTVNSLPIASITSLNGNTFCQGSSVTLVSSPGSSYAWSNGLTTQSISVSASANLTVTVTNANGCSATSAPFAVTMNAAPVATVTANGPTTFCQGGQVILSAPAAASYLWNSGETTQTIVVNVDGPYTVTITNANNCSATSANMNITVLPIPTVAAIAGANQVCVGSTLNLTNATIGGVWSTSNTSVATIDANGIVTALTAGTVTINYAVTNASGCTTTSSMVLNVNALPAVLPIAGANSLCVGTQVVYTNGIAGGTWSSSNVGVASVAANGVIIGISAGTATISYTVSTAAGCSSTVTKVVTVNALPSVSVAANGPLTFCQGGSVTLTASGGTSYAWANGPTSASIVVNASGSYSVTATNANGCFATSAPVVVNVLALPNAAISSTGSTICLGSTTTLTATGGVSYAWSNGANTASTTVNNSNTYTVTVTGANGCINTASNVVTVNPNPAVVVTANGPLTFCSGGSVSLSATGAASYVWSNGTLGSSNVITQSGTYYVQGTNAQGCTANSAVVTVNVLTTPVVAAITGANTVCESSTITLTSATPGGVWSTSNGFIATVNNAGVVTGMNAGNAVITYTLSNGACNASVSASVTVMNSPATPVITAGGPTTVCPGETVNLFASNSPNYQWNSGQLTNNILVTQSGSYTVTVIGSNGCAVTSLPTVVTIGDNIAPSIVAPINVNVNPNLGCTAVGVALGTPTVSDNCSIASVTNNAPALFPIGTTTVTWTVTDGSGNTSTATQLVNVVDQIAPVATAPANITVNANNFCDATGVNLGTPNATDNCTIATITNNAPASFPIGTTVVTWTITDLTGNFTTVTQNVTVVDNVAPVVVLQSAALQLDANGYATLTFAAIDNGSSDNCGIASVSIDQTVFDCAHVGFNTVEVTITDNSGNQAKGQVIINVLASEACGSVEAAGPNVPDVFTPNGNSVNDTWVIPGLEGYNTKQMAVYSRYGTLVYYSAAYANDWDGTLMGNGVAVPDGTYYYILDLDGGKQLSGYVYINRVKQ
jgi:gliding motility-associated-like protein